ncbi:hypothetical protein RUM43_010420 [Polyplax serrata]|uniref:Uncharacterized protein n=1 Tax=Polyplax serrata TaxID=468196 RepID=A0AAN8Q4V5_POLSC
MTEEDNKKDDEEKEEVKSAISKKKLASKMAIPSKSSLKSSFSSSSDTSGSSLAMKRQSEFDKLAKPFVLSQGPRYQNTYRLDPKRPFKANEVYKILQTIVEREVVNFLQYDGLMGPKIVQTIAAEVRSAVKLLNYDRYKICVIVYLGEKKLHGFQAAFRGLWDHERDGWTTYFYQCRTYFVSCTCFGLYHD